MTWPPILVDEDYPLPVAHALRDWSSTLVEITAEGVLRGSSDPSLVDHAASLSGVLISQNQRGRARFRAHILTWRQRGNDTLCVLFLPRDLDGDRLLLRTQLLLDWYQSRPHPKPETLIWNDCAQALIHGYQPSGYTSAEVLYTLGQQARRE